MGALIQVFGHAKCSATRAAQRFFAERKVKIQFVDVRVKNLSKGELASVARGVGGIEALLDLDGARARERGLHMLARPSAARIEELLLGDARLYRTPIVRSGTRATVGPDEAAWKAWLAHDAAP